MKGKFHLVVVLLTLLSSCSGEDAAAPGGISANLKEPRSIAITLNANYNHPLEGSTTLSENLQFVPPPSISVVQGMYSGNPSEWLRANLRSGSLFDCKYFATDTTATTLVLDSCDYMPDPTQPKDLPAGATIQLVNVTCQGMLIEANFTLSN